MRHHIARLCALALVVVSASAAGLSEPPTESADGSSSAVTVSGHPGRYDDFSNLKITVSQTKNLTAQAIHLNWTGGSPTPRRSFTYNYLSLMQCWGPDPNAADFRETCQFGAGLPAPIASRSGDASRAVFPSLDPRETHQPIPVTAQQTTPSLPFKSAAGGTYIDAGRDTPSSPPRKPPTGYAGLVVDLFSANSTNEQPWVPIAADGTGEAVFWLQTVTESPHLGCGAPIKSGTQLTGRSCWLVIVPKGQHAADGSPLNDQSLDPNSPLSATNWENRIAVPLQFDPVQGFCSIGAKERLTVGSELISDAMVSWQPALCAGGGAAYGYAPLGDGTAAQQLLSGFDGAPGLAFTGPPVVPKAGQPEVVHAPVAISGIGIAFLVDEDPGTFAPEDAQQKRGRLIEDIKLTPRLVAKLLTQSYQQDVPGDPPHPQLKQNPYYITYDPEFRQLNPEFDHFPDFASGPRGLMVVGGNAAAIREVWRWVIADAQARDWLGGKPDENGMVVNPNYAQYNLTKDAPQNFPKADPTCAKNPVTAPEQYCTQDLRPYLGSFANIAQRVLRSDAGERRVWDPLKQPLPAYVNSPPLPVSRRWALGVTDTADAERYGVRMASLRNASGQFVAPTTSALLAGVDAMKDSGVDGVLSIDPTANAPTAYPLTIVTYAAVNTQQDQEARTEYAKFLEYAATTGQEPGVERGRLPAGYAPLPGKMRQKTLAVAAQLRQAQPTPPPPPTRTPTPPSSTPSSSGTPVSPGDPGNPGGGPIGTNTAQPPGTVSTSPGGVSPNPSVVAGQSPSVSTSPPPVTLSPIPRAARTSTPPTLVGMAGWILTLVLAVGAIAGLGGIGLRVVATQRAKRRKT
ncbi:hypothetical protein ACQHIV_37710 [Kribbella sp. GL6]|uniref:hypothetical protein n=1 Tax=Kribbella sp. GL6 TaxID=3419765 RepID=UPI003D036110